MFRLAILSYEWTEDEIYSQTLGSSDDFKARTIDCLIAGEHTNPEDHTIEALVCYAHAEWMESEDARIDLSVVIGMIVRLAMRMGIHREPKAHFGLTPFQEEMRRRLWARIEVMDIQYSFQISLPASVRPGECDCTVPRNIWNRDFDESTLELPPPLSLVEDTEISYMILKTRLILVFGKILAHTEHNHAITTETVMKYEQELSEIRKDIPARLQISIDADLTNSNHPPVHLDRIYQGARCLLYRKFLKRDSPHLRYRGSCIDAAMTLLKYHSTFFVGVDTRDPRKIKQRYRSMFISHDFYIACMAIALDLHYGYESEPTAPSMKDVALWGMSDLSLYTACHNLHLVSWSLRRSGTNTGVRRLRPTAGNDRSTRDLNRILETFKGGVS